MHASDIKRLICVTAIGTGDSAGQCTPAARILLRNGLRWLFKEKDRQEQIIKASGNDWTLIRPAALTNGRIRGAQISEAPTTKCGLLTHVSRADVASTIVNLLEDPASYQKALTLMYLPRVGDSLRWLLGYMGIG
jgi:hypothetical protein